MTWTAEQLRVLEGENVRIGFRPGELLPAPAHPALTEPAGYLALLGAIPDGAGAAGYLEALRRHTEEHPLDEAAT